MDKMGRKPIASERDTAPVLYLSYLSAIQTSESITLLFGEPSCSAYLIVVPKRILF
jgi:hypothetical protein